MKPLLPLVLVCALGCLCWVGCEQAAPSISLPDAIEKGFLRTVQQHIAAKTDLNKPNAAGLTPLHLAAAKGDPTIFKALLDAGADPKRKAPDGKTPLDVARARGQTAIVQLLQPGTGKGGRGLIDGGLGVSDALNNM